MPIQANESVQDLLTTLKSREEDQTHQSQPPKKKVFGTNSYGQKIGMKLQGTNC
jgi:hypothetical protein